MSFVTTEQRVVLEALADAQPQQTNELIATAEGSRAHQRVATGLGECESGNLVTQTDAGWVLTVRGANVAADLTGEFVAAHDADGERASGPEPMTDGGARLCETRGCGRVGVITYTRTGERRCLPCFEDDRARDQVPGVVEHDDEEPGHAISETGGIDVLRGEADE